MTNETTRGQETNDKCEIAFPETSDNRKLVSVPSANGNENISWNPFSRIRSGNESRAAFRGARSVSGPTAARDPFAGLSEIEARDPKVGKVIGFAERKY